MPDQPRYMAKLTARARDALNMAAQEAVRAGRRTIGAEMLLIALLCQERSAAAVALEAEGVDLGALRDALRALYPTARSASPAEPVRNRRFRRALDAAFDAARELGNPYIGTEHLLLGAAANLSRAGTQAAQPAGLALESLRERIEAHGAQKVDDATPDRWNELLKAELAEKLKEIDLDAPQIGAVDAATRRTGKAAPADAPKQRWEYRATALGGGSTSPERLAGEIEDSVNRQTASGWEYVDLSVVKGPDGLSAVLIVRKQV
jgi:ATP-dependent Clp protease ATP-binding subunit ClpA